MTDRERLIGLMIEAKRTDPETGSFTEHLADYLLANGVIVLPCKVGDTVYQIDAERVFESQVEAIIYATDSIAFDERVIGKTVFLTREEAERALKEREENV